MEIIVEKVLAEITICLNQVSGDSLARAEKLIEDAPRVYVSGAGRSGLVMRALGTRLMHLGKTVFIVGDASTPGIQAGDLLILGSGSGQTSTLLTISQKAKLLGAKILLFTTDPTSPLASGSDMVVTLPAPSLNDGEGTGDHKSIQPMGTLFEQSLLILCDSLILGLMVRMGVRPDQMRERHANLE